eukprot:SAG11_NODE_2678_length_3105_cov_2.120758_4_plen_59_part_00
MPVPTQNSGQAMAHPSLPLAELRSRFPSFLDHAHAASERALLQPGDGESQAAVRRAES